MRLLVSAVWVLVLVACSGELRSERPGGPHQVGAPSQPSLQPAPSPSPSSPLPPLGRPTFEPRFAPPPAPPTPPVAEEPTPPVVQDPCEVERVTVVKKIDERRYEVSAQLRSRVSRALSLTYRASCPQGAARFTGLVEGYDYYASCAAGACAEPVTTTTQTLEAGATVTLDTVTIHVRGKSCQPRLDKRRYELSFDVELDGATTCAAREPAVLDLAPIAMPARPTTRPSPKPTRRCPPMPACGIGCPGGMAHDEHGCALCACEDNPLDVLRAR